jgi:hypothetical protein
MKKKTKIGKKQVFWLDVDPYKQECIVVVNGTFQDGYNTLKKCNTVRSKASIKHIDSHREQYFGIDEEQITGSLTIGLPYGYIMNVNHLDSWQKTVCNIVHESLHLVNNVLGKAGLTMNGNNDEAFTYLQEKIVLDILRKMY